MSTDIENILARVHAKKAKLDTYRPLAPDVERRIYDELRMDWNYHSNHIEGNSLTYGETIMLLMHGITSGGRPFRDSMEMRGHDEALRWVLDIIKGPYPLDQAFIRELHILLLKEAYQSPAITPDGIQVFRTITPGVYKTLPNHVLTSTGEIFRFAEPFETPAKMTDLIDWYMSEKEKIDIDPIIFAVDFHYKFIRIHPFDDGNGRTVRILMNFILMQYGYTPAIVRTEEKDTYLYALRIADTGDISHFYRYIAEKVEQSLDTYLENLT